MEIIFRVDASFKIGSGHIMRCLTLAKELNNNQTGISFISRSLKGNLNEFIVSRGIKLIELPDSDSSLRDSSKTENNYCNDWIGGSLEQDSYDTIKVLGKTMIDWLIVDHYGLDEKWENALRPFVKKIMVIDDLANRKHNCDIILDQNWFNSFENRYNKLVPENCVKLLGPKYSLLRQEFSIARKKLRKKTSSKLKRIFVFFGGFDANNLTSLVIKSLSSPEFLHLEIDVVIGDSNPHKIEVEKHAKSRSKTNLYVQANNIAEIMSKSDLAISSGGSNTWERMCVKLYSIVITTAENQEEVASNLANEGLIDYLGKEKEITGNLIKNKINEFIEKDLSFCKNKFLKDCDGLGTIRVRKFIQDINPKIITNKISI